MNYLLIGRPNVGKSSLFNILTGSNSKIIQEESVTSQDWHRSKLVSQSNIYIYDTPGIILNIKNKKKINVTNLLKRVIFNIDVFLCHLWRIYREIWKFEVVCLFYPKFHEKMRTHSFSHLKLRRIVQKFGLR